MRPSLQVRLSQHLALTPQLQQSIRLLQLSTLELQQEVEQMLDQNPFLEADEEAAAADAPLERAGSAEPQGERAAETGAEREDAAFDGGEDPIAVRILDGAPVDARVGDEPVEDAVGDLSVGALVVEAGRGAARVGHATADLVLALGGALHELAAHVEVAHLEQGGHHTSVSSPR